jgi:4-hydroxybenzoate polyprenyltransferase
MSFKLLKKLIKEFIYGGHLLSIGAASIVWSTLIIVGHNLENAWPILLLAYLSSQIVYNHDHLDEINDEFANAERSKHLRETRNYQIVSLIFYVSLFVVTSFFTTLEASLLAFFIVIGGIFYTKKAKKFTKRITGFKNIYIAFFWSILAFFIPFHYTEASFGATVLTFAFFIFVRWILNTVFFDIKDEKDDKKKGLKTLPAEYGLSKTIFYLHIVNIISGLIVGIGVLLQIIPVFGLSLLTLSLYSFYYLYKTKGISESRLRVVSYVVVDGEYLLWPFILLFSKMIFE